MTYALQIFTAFLGAFGFSVLFNIRRTKLWIASVGGALDWSIYLALGTVLTGDAVRYFFAAAFVTVYAEIFARIKKTPTTSFLVSGIIPLVPGGALYNTMKYALNSDWLSFGETAIYTVQLAMAIAAGIMVVSSLIRVIAAGFQQVVIRYVKK